MGGTHILSTSTSLSRIPCRLFLKSRSTCSILGRFTNVNSTRCNLPSAPQRNFSLGRKIAQPLHETHPHLLDSGELTKGIHKDEYKRRRDKLVESMQPNSVAIFFSAPQKIMSANIPYVDINDSYESHHNVEVSYLSGFQETDAILVLEKYNKGYSFFMFVRETDPDKELWDGPSAGTAVMVPIFGCDKAFTIEQANDIIKPILSRASIIYTKKNIWPEMTQKLEMNTHYDTKVTDDKILQELRLIKSPAEIELMKQSGAIAAESFAKTIEFTRAGMLESYVHAKMEFECKVRGAQRLAYPPVVAGGNNALSLHYVHNTDLLREGEMVLVDAGCEYHGYCSDITRTWPVSKKFTAAQRAVYEVVLDCNKKCIELVKPGNSIGTAHTRSSTLLYEGLTKIGVLPKRATYSSLFGKLYPHSIGHYLGMNLHDTYEVSTHKPLQAGMIVTIEPGVYIPPHPSIPECFHNICVRIEDDVLVTSGSPMVLTHKCPKEISDLENIEKYNEQFNKK